MKKLIQQKKNDTKEASMIQKLYSALTKVLTPSHSQQAARISELESEVERLLEINERVMLENNLIKIRKDEYAITLKNENERLLVDNGILQGKADSLKELLSEIDKEIIQIIRNHQSGNEKAVFDIIKQLDPEGRSIYRASKKILGINVYSEFIIEDTLGWFEESSGYELKKYVEIAAFGNRTYRFVGNCEILDDYTIDYDTDEYKEYIKELYPMAIEEFVKTGYPSQEPMKKLHLYKDLNNIKNYARNNNLTQR